MMKITTNTCLSLAVVGFLIGFAHLPALASPNSGPIATPSTPIATRSTPIATHSAQIATRSALIVTRSTPIATHSTQISTCSAQIATRSAASPSIVPAPYASFETTKGRAGTSRVWIGERLVFTFDEDNGTVAKAVAGRLNDLHERGALQADRAQPGRRENRFVVSLGETDLLVFDKRFARYQGMQPRELTLLYVNQLRKALGDPVMQAKTERIVHAPSRGGFSPRESLVGFASWYGGFFHGRRAADGSRFNQNELTAAHKTLPFGTRLLVTNLETKRSTVVRVTDRGPFVKGRMIDLSRAAAKAIGMLHSGVSRVKVTVFRSPS